MLLTGCVETIVMDPHEKDLPVVIQCVLSNPSNETVIVPDSASTAGLSQKQTMTIRYVKGKSEDDYIPVEDAVVYIHASDSLKGTEGTMRFVYAGDGVWETESPVRILNETKYSLFVKIPGKETIWAETVSQPYITNGLYLPDDWLDLDDSEKEDLLMQHPFIITKGDGPAWIFAQGYTPQGWKDLEYLVTDHPYADEMNVTGRSFSELSLLGNKDAGDWSDERIRYVFENSQRLMPNLPLHKNYLRISKIEPEVPFFLFAGPVWYLNLEANDNYGHYEDVFIRWELEWDENNEVPVRVPVYERQTWEWNRYFRFHFHFVNSDLDEYLRSIYIQEHKTGNYLTSLYSTANTYTNIHGGLGIFGCDFRRIINFIEPRSYVLVN